MLCYATTSSRLSARILRPRFYALSIDRGLRTRSNHRAIPPSNQSTGRQEVEQHASEPPQSPNSSHSPADVSSMLSTIDPSQNPLITPVHIPEDANAVLKSDHPATNILSQSGLVVTRQIEMMNVFLGFEQANKYTIMDAQGNHVGYMAEHDGGLAKTMGRQWFRTHRAFTTHVFDKHAREVLRFHRPFSWINSRIRVYDPLEVGKYAPQSNVTQVSTDVKAPNTLDGIHQISDLPLEAMRVIGETHSEWAPLRRKYHLFLAHHLATQDSSTQTVSHDRLLPSLPHEQRQDSERKSADNFAQFASINEPFLSWDFSLRDVDSKLIGSVNRNFRGFGREIFTDTGMYILRMDSAGSEGEADKSHIGSQSHHGEAAYAETVGHGNDATGMTLDQRAIMLATAVTVDFDYFSRHSHGGGMFMPMFMGGGEAGGAGAAGAAGAEAGGVAAGAGAAEGAGAVVGGAGRAVGGAATGVGAGAAESGIAGAGTIAGYEAMQRGMGRGYSPGDGPRPDQQLGSTDPDSPQYGTGYDSQSSPSSPAQGENSDDVWGSGEQDPWSSNGNGNGNNGDGGSTEGGGLMSQLWDSFFGD